MTNEELNRDIERLATFVKHNCDGARYSDEYAKAEVYVKTELKRLYYADTSLKSSNADSLRTLIRLNGRFRAIPLHTFGLHIEL